jgi:putative phosphoribosyl transferase
MQFIDRHDAGRRLAAVLGHFRTQQPVVLALPRGGVPVGFEIASALDAPLDVVLVRKIGAPGMSELAVGAIVDGEQLDEFIDRERVAELGVPQTYLDDEIRRQAAEIERRRRLYFKSRAPVSVAGCTALVVDDGIATGATMRAALRAVRRRGPATLVLAVPVGPASTVEALRPEVDEVVCLDTPDDFYAIGQFYAAFHQMSDEEVVALLDRALRRPSAVPQPVTGDDSEAKMKSILLLAPSGALAILTSYASVENERLIEKLKLKGIEKFVAFEIPLELAMERYGVHFRAVSQDLHETDDLRVLDFDGQRALRLFRFQELGAPILHEGG